jgi:hypothetical protein
MRPSAKRMLSPSSELVADRYPTPREMPLTLNGANGLPAAHVTATTLAISARAPAGEPNSIIQERPARLGASDPSCSAATATNPSRWSAATALDTCAGLSWVSPMIQARAFKVQARALRKVLTCAGQNGPKPSNSSCAISRAFKGSGFGCAATADPLPLTARIRSRAGAGRRAMAADIGAHSIRVKRHGEDADRVVEAVPAGRSAQVA